MSELLLTSTVREFIESKFDGWRVLQLALPDNVIVVMKPGGYGFRVYIDLCIIADTHGMMMNFTYDSILSVISHCIMSSHDNMVSY